MKRIFYISDAKSIHTRRWVEHYRDQGIQVHLASFRFENIEGVHVHLLPTYGLGRIGYLLAVPSLRRLFKRIQPDVVHAQYVTSYGFMAALAGLKPLVLTAWGTDVLLSPDESRVLRWFASYAVRHANMVTTVAQHMNAAVARLGINENKVIAVPFGVDTKEFLPPAAPRSETMPFRLICTRNFGPIYSVHTLISALQNVDACGIKLLVDLVGEGPLRGELEAQVEFAGLSSWVSFHGHVNHTYLTKLLAQAHIFVSPALSDGNNISLNEAMACSCFPIATDIPANSQWIEHGNNGLLYPPGDATRLAQCIIQAVENVALRERASTINREIIELRADWRVCVKQMDDTYAKAIRYVQEHK